MKVTGFEIPDLKLVEAQVFGDERGFFTERFNRRKYEEAGLPTNFVQDNHSRSAPGVVRGLHWQHNPDQGKLVGVVSGKIWDVVVDIRPDSPTFGLWEAAELTGENGRFLWVPPGFAHGFCVLGDKPADVLYKVTDFYDPKAEGGILWNDPEIRIHWPVKNPTVSARDQKLMSFADYRAKPIHWD
jgi:dTDP-4-dehydrorhamnose 3,5-epimerase